MFLETKGISSTKTKFHANGRIKTTRLKTIILFPTQSPPQHSTPEKEIKKVKVTRADYGNKIENWDSRSFSHLNNLLPLAT